MTASPKSVGKLRNNEERQTDIMARTTYGNRPTNAYGNTNTRQNIRTGSRPAAQPAGRAQTRSASGRRNGSYVYGSAAPKLNVQQEMERQPRRALSNATRKNREKARHMSLGYVLFLVLAMCVAGYVLIHYIQLQADITEATERIASQQKELNTLRVNNDEELSRITSSIDMEEVKRVAIGELGMVYPQEGQVITYSNEGKDYVRKVDGSK